MIRARLNYFSRPVRARPELCGLIAGLIFSFVSGEAVAKDASPPVTNSSASTSTSATSASKNSAKPDDPVSCVIRSIYGTAKEATGIDKQLSFLHRQLSRPPFSSFKTLKLLEEKNLEVPPGQMRQLSLPSGKILRLTYKDMLIGSKKKPRLRFNLSITPPKEKKFLPSTTFTLVNRGTLLVAGENFQQGTMIVGVTCWSKNFVSAVPSK